VTGLSNGTGIYVKDDSPQAYDFTVSGCKWGVQLIGSGSDDAPQITSNAVRNVISNCTTGLYSTANDPLVTGTDLTSCTTGLYTNVNGGGTFGGLTITGGATGIRAKSTTSHTIRASTVTGFTSNGVDTQSGAGVDLGTATDHGDNNIYSTAVGSKGKYVKVKPYLSFLPDIQAQGNWWGASPPPASRFSAGVDYGNARTTQYTPSSLRRGLEIGLVGPSLRTFPNPLAAGTTIQYSLGEGETEAMIQIFDVRGRLVRRWDVRSETGVHRLAWDGRDSRGRDVGAGVFFLRLQGMRTNLVHKLVRSPK